MDSRERVLAAIHHQVPDRVPVDAICIENGDAIAAHLGVAPEAVPGELRLDGQIVAACRCTDTVPGAGAEAGAGSDPPEWCTDAADDYGTTHAYPLADARTVADVERFRWPDPARYDFAAAARQAERLAQVRAVRGPYWLPLFCRACSLFGMEEAMVKMTLAPRVFEAAVEAIFQHTAEYCRRLLAACGDAMPILCLGDDFATQRGMMISPADWRRFLKRRLAALFQIGKDAGKVVWFHSCGDVTAVLPDLIEIGMDVWETVQLHTLPMSAAALKSEYGRHVTFFGGVNTQRLPFARPDEVREEVIRCIEALGAGGGYICGPDHHVKPDVPPANVVTLFRTATAFRRPGYTG